MSYYRLVSAKYRDIRSRMLRHEGKMWRGEKDIESPEKANMATSRRQKQKDSTNSEQG